MSRAKYAAAAALATALETATPALAGRIEVLQQPPQELSDYPTAAILPGLFRTSWNSSYDDLLDDDLEAVTDDDGNALVNVGTLSGTMQVWLAAEYPADRENLEGRILAAFVDGETAGRIDVDVDIALYAPALGVTTSVAFYCDGEAWREEMAFSERRWAILDLSVDLSIYVGLPVATFPVVTELRLSITRDLTDVSDAATPEAAEAALTGVETYSIASDGTYTEI